MYCARAWNHQCYGFDEQRGVKLVKRSLGAAHCTQCMYLPPIRRIWFTMQRGRRRHGLASWSSIIIGYNCAGCGRLDEVKHHLLAARRGTANITQDVRSAWSTVGAGNTLFSRAWLPQHDHDLEEANCGVASQQIWDHLLDVWRRRGRAVSGSEECKTGLARPEWAKPALDPGRNVSAPGTQSPSAHQATVTLR